MEQEKPQFIYKTEEDRQLARILSILIWAAWGAYSVVILVGLYYRDLGLIAVTLAGCALQIAPWILTRRRHLNASSLTLMVSIIGTLTVIATLGQGIRDLAITAFPIVFVFASLAMNRNVFRLCVGLTLAAVGWLVFGEAAGLYIPKPYAGTPGWINFLLVAVIFSVAALAADLLATNMRKNLELAQLEIARRTLAEKSLQDSESRFRTLIENAPIAITLGRDGKLLYANPVYVKMHGFASTVELIGRPTVERVAPPCRAEALERARRRAQGLPVETHYELLGLRQDGTEIPLLAAVTQVQLADGPANIGFFQDITARRRAEDAVKNSERRFHALVKHGRDNISMLAADGTLLWESPSAVSTLGYAQNQFVGRNIFELMHPDDQAWTSAMYAQVVQAPGSIQEGAFRLLHANGAWRWIECSATNLLDEPSVQAIVLNYRDITARKRAEDALWEQEVQYHALADSGIALIWVSGTDKLCSYFNLPWLKFTGRALEQELGNGWAEGVHPDDFARCLETYVTAFDKRESFEMDYRLRHASGEYRWIQDLGTPNYNSNGEFIGYIGHCFDITERKQTQKALQESEERYRRLVENAPDIVYTFSNQRGGIYYSPRVERVLGYPAEHLYKHPRLWNASIHPDDRSQVDKVIHEFEIGKLFDIEYRIQDTQGNWHWLRDRSIGRDVGNGEVLIEGLATDITERKRAENSLAKTQALLAEAEKIGKVGGWEFDLDTRKLTITEEVYRIYEADFDYEPTLEDAINFFYTPTSRPIIEKAAQRAIEYGESFDAELEIITAKGNLRFVHGIGKVDFEHCRVSGYVQDITERKRAENELFQQKSMLSTIMESISESIFIKDLDGKYVVINQAGARTLGYNVTDVLGHTDLELLPAETAHEFLKMDADTIASGQMCEREEIGIINGKTMVLLAHKTPWRDNSGKILGIIGVSTDITERKLTEEQLRYNSTHDALTGIYNRAFFETEMARMTLNREFPTSLIIADLDGLKVANDTLGHALGDELIRQTANALRSVFRESDVLARIGGDEFAVLLPRTDAASAEQMLARVQARLAKHNAENPELPVHLSLGTATAARNNLTETFRVADERMYANKAARKANANRASVS